MITKKPFINIFEQKEKHEFHLVSISQIPIYTAFAAHHIALSLIYYWYPIIATSNKIVEIAVFQTALLYLILGLFVWFNKVVEEGGQGNHTDTVRIGLRLGMGFFIVSEVMFFFAFFWGFFQVSFSPSMSIGCVWPPKGVQELAVWDLPLLNTILLLSSGLTITFAHHSIFKGVIRGYINMFDKHLFATMMLGIIFLFCQYIEYKLGITFSWKENVFGSTFFITTGFHGFHVTIGTIFLLFCFIRVISKHTNKFFQKNQQRFVNYLGDYNFSKSQHLGFEAAAWYWHFVDIVWIFLFITVYWWGS